MTPKQLLFFEPMIEKLEKRHTVICTSRRYRELSHLSKIRGSKVILVGRHGGKSTESKLRAGIRRMAMLQKIMEKERPDLTISSCSSDASRIAYGLGINHIGFTDSPYATIAMRLSIPLLQKLLIPFVIPKSECTRFGIHEKDIIRYNAIDAFVTTRHSVSKKQKNPFSKNKKTILVRVEQEQAAYIRKIKSSAIIESLINNTDAEIAVLGRYTDQIKKIKKRFGNKVRVLEKYDGKMLLANADLFVGSGGTMTAESVLLGTPTISYNAVPNLIEKYLIKKRVAFREENPAKIARMANRILREDKSAYMRRAKKLTSQMEDPYPVLVRTMKLLK